MCDICQGSYDQDHNRSEGPLCPACGLFRMGADYRQPVALVDILEHPACAEKLWRDRCRRCKRRVGPEAILTEGQEQPCYHCFGTATLLDPCETCVATGAWVENHEYGANPRRRPL